MFSDHAHHHHHHCRHRHTAVSRLSHVQLTGTGPQFGQLSQRYVTPTGLVVVSAPWKRRAAQAGLLVGDRVVLVNGHAADGESPEQVVEWVLESAVADLLVLHDPQLATALIMHGRSGKDIVPTSDDVPPPPPPTTATTTITLSSGETAPASDSKPSSRARKQAQRKQERYEEYNSEDEEAAVAAAAATSREAAAAAAAATTAASAAVSSTFTTAPFTWRAAGLTAVQKSDLLAQRREELLSVDLSSDPTLREEWQCLIVDRDAMLKREFIREYGAAPGARGGGGRRSGGPARATSPVPAAAATSRSPGSGSSDPRRRVASALSDEEGGDEGTASLVAENASLQKRVDELWAVIGLFKQDGMAEKLLEMKVSCM
jgi:hypothetical protein